MMPLLELEIFSEMCTHIIIIIVRSKSGHINQIVSLPTIATDIIVLQIQWKLFIREIVICYMSHSSLILFHRWRRSLTLNIPSFNRQTLIRYLSSYSINTYLNWNKTKIDKKRFEWIIISLRSVEYEWKFDVGSSIYCYYNN